MYTMNGKRTSTGYDLYRDGQLVASLKNEWDLECSLNSHGVHERFCSEFLHRMRETGEASEDMPVIDFKILY